MSNQEHIGSDLVPPAESNASPSRWRRWLKWLLLGAGVLFVALILLVLSYYLFAPGRDGRDTITQVMTSEFGPYAQEQQGWIWVNNQQTYVMRVQTQNEIELAGKRRLLLAVSGFPLNDEDGHTGQLQYRFLVLDMSGKKTDEVSYFGVRNGVEDALSIKEVKIEMIHPGEQMYGWQLDYEQNEDGHVAINREIYLIDFAKSEVIYSGSLPLRYDTTGVCQRMAQEAADKRKKVSAEASASTDVASGLAETSVTASQDEEGSDFQDVCWDLRASYQPDKAKGTVIAPWQVKAISRSDEGEHVLNGKVVFDPHTLKLKLPKKVSELFAEPFNE